MGIGGGKSSGSQQAIITEEQKDLLKEQTGFLKNTAFPAYQRPVGMAGDVYGQVNPTATNAANTAMGVAGRTGALQEAGGSQAYNAGLGGQQNVASSQQSLGNLLSGKGAGGASNIAAQQQNLSQGLTNAGAGGTANMAGYQQGLGQGLTGQGAGGVGNLANMQTGQGGQLFGQGASDLGQMSNYQRGVGQGLTAQGAGQLSQLFSPQYAEQQVKAALQPAMEQTREAMGAQNAGFGAAGGLGSSRAALANRNLESLSNQRLGTVAATTQQGIEANRAAASQAILGAGQGASNQAQSGYGSLAGLGQGALGQAGSLYGNILNAGQNASGQAQNAYGNLLSTGQGAANTAAGIYGNLLGTGQGATGQAGSLYGNLAGQGASSLAGANQAAAARIGYAQTPQDVLAKYASVIYGTPQQSTTPNFAGTQGSTGSSKSGGFGASLSDINAKQNIQKIGVLSNGINLYKYQYKPEFRDQWGHGVQIGVIAQEVELVMPEAVVSQDNGYKAVDYSLVLQ
jgi:hypothetical protein